jgi:choline dehydrogenase-like flavoprotein
MTSVEKTDVLVIGSGFGGAIPAYHLAAGGAKVIVLERGPWLQTEELAHNFQFGTWTRIFDLAVGDGLSTLTGNCVGGGSIVYFAASPRAPRFVFERRGGIGRRLWPHSVTRAKLDPWYDRVEESLPVVEQQWSQVPYAGGLFAAACEHAGRTANPVPQAVDMSACTECNWMLTGCRFDAKRSLLLNYLPAALAHGAQIRPLHEVQRISRTWRGDYQVHFRVVDPDDYRVYHEEGRIEAKIVVLAAGPVGTPVILQRSQEFLGQMPSAVGRYLSGNGERISTALVDETKVREVLGLSRSADIAYEASYIGRSATVGMWDLLDERLPEFERFSLEQLFFPPGLGTILAQAPGVDGPSWFGLEKKELRKRWRSWLTIFAMTEDDNEGVFGPPPPVGSFTRLSQQMLGQGSFSYHPNENTRRGWDASDVVLKSILERDGIAQVTPWSESVVGEITVHPVSSCRIGDDPRISALDPMHELRGHRGIFVTDASAVPTSVCVNPSLTISALAERAVPAIVHRARSKGVRVRYGAPAPDGATSARRAVLPQVKHLVD